MHFFNANLTSELFCHSEVANTVNDHQLNNVIHQSSRALFKQDGNDQAFMRKIDDGIKSEQEGTSFLIVRGGETPFMFGKTLSCSRLGAILY